VKTSGAVRGMLETMVTPSIAVADAEEALIERARRGDREAFERLVEAHLPRVWAAVWRILRHREDTEDVVQEVFLSAYRSIRAFRGDSRLSTWLQRIATTRALNHLDRSAERLRRASRPLDEVAEDTLSMDNPSRQPSPLQALEARELARRLDDCLRRLPAAWRAALALRDGEESSYERMALILNVALGTVRSRLARARLALRRCIEGEGA
jgi:RNA polymerase sigma-70 factor (ECF subfamily)